MSDQTGMAQFRVDLKLTEKYAKKFGLKTECTEGG